MASTHGRCGANWNTSADDLFATELDRNRVERALRDRPIPERCPLTVDEAEQHIAQAEAVEQNATELVHAVILAAAKLLQQPALRSLLEQGKAEAFIAEVLAAADPEALSIVLATRLSASPDCAKLLAKYLKQIQVKPVRLSDFHPSKSTIEPENIENVVTEFRVFLESAFAQDGQKQSVVIRIQAMIRLSTTEITTRRREAVSASKKPARGSKVFPGFTPAQKTFAGYYSGNQPNSNLRQFVDLHAKPFDPENDKYCVPAFTEQITTTKVNAIYNMHTYWSKKPHDAIRKYMRHYTAPGDLVLDPFCGSGGTALAALLEGRTAIASDLIPPQPSSLRTTVLRSIQTNSYLHFSNCRNL